MKNGKQMLSVKKENIKHAFYWEMLKSKNKKIWK